MLKHLETKQTHQMMQESLTITLYAKKNSRIREQVVLLLHNKGVPFLFVNAGNLSLGSI